MSGSKKYAQKKGSTPEAKEPLPIFGAYTKRLHFLAGIKPNDLSRIDLSGDILSSLQEETSLSPYDIAGIVGVSKSKYYDLIKQGELGQKHIDALADFANLWKIGLEAFEQDQSLLNEWLETRNENLGGIKPKELLASRIGRRELQKAFLRVEYSTYG